MPTKTMIHKGVQPVTVPAKTELREVPDEQGGEGAVKLEEVEVEKERTETVTLPPGTRFGDYLIKQPYEIEDVEMQKHLTKRGFDTVSREQAKKLDAKAEKAEDQLPNRRNDEVAKEERERAAESQAKFDSPATVDNTPTKEGKR